MNKTMRSAEIEQRKPDVSPNASHERIIRVARTLFCQNGIHATGVDRILAEANASKMALYGHFGSKEALIREVLRREGADWRDVFFQVIGDPDESGAGLARTIDAVDAIFHTRPFHGCAFMNAIAEHTKGEVWLRDLAAEHHGHILAFLERHGAAAGYPEPALLARQLLLLVDGTVAALMVTGDPSVLGVAKRNLRAILHRG